MGVHPFLGAGVTIPLPYAWYDASQITGVSDGANYDSFTDFAGNGNTLNSVQTNNLGTHPKYYKTTSAKLINGLPAVWFATSGGTANYLFSSGNLALWDGTGQFTSFIVFVQNLQVGGGNTPQILASEGVSSAHPAPAFGFIGGTENTPGCRVTNTAFASFNNLPGTTITTGTQHLIAARTNSSTSKVSCWIDSGTKNDVSYTGTLYTTAAQITMANGASGFFFDGAVGEAKVFNSALSDAQVTAEIAILKGKWGTP